MINDSKISNLLKGIEDAKGLLNEFITPEIKKSMTPEQLEQLTDVNKMINIDLPKASKELAKINEKYNRNGTPNR